MFHVFMFHVSDVGECLRESAHLVQRAGADFERHVIDRGESAEALR